MQTFLIVVQIIVAIGMIALILLQRSEGGGLVQSGGGSGGMMSTRTTANLLTKLTSIFAAVFMGLCLLQAIIAAQGVSKKTILKPVAPVSAPATSETVPVPVPDAPEKVESKPAVPAQTQKVPTKGAPSKSAK